MTITLRPGSTVVFTGDSITDCQRLRSEDGLGFGYPGIEEPVDSRWRYPRVT
ncbi:hypothetical protein [Nonomuraea sp. NPDC049141]|uniref:hypothetical protein n=1 Tax=unclassified Nonomuraea TaxID=2593643 RepID=UPI00340A981E